MQLAIFVWGILTSLALLQAALAIWFVRLFYQRPPGPAVADIDLPTAAILLSLRGADPYLAQGLRRLLQQHYPHYEVRIVVDRQDDPAWQVVQQVLGEMGASNVHVSPLRHRRETCSLKNSALLQLLADLDETCDVVVLADGDLLPHREWLRELVTPLCEEGVGATFGNRWFMPPEGHWGSLVRYLWNAAGIVPMYFQEMVWGGTFAIWTSVLHRSGLVDQWAHAIVDDAPVRHALLKEGLCIRFVPSLMMVNRERCDLRFCFNFIRRQLTWTRIYHRNWALVALHALVTTSAMATAAVLAPFGLVSGRLVDAVWAGTGLAAYVLVMFGLLLLLEHGIRRVVQARGESMVALPLNIWPKLWVAVLVAHGVHMAAVVLATFQRSITWRGVTYCIRGPWNIRMVDDRFAESLSRADHTNTSL